MTLCPDIDVISTLFSLIHLNLWEAFFTRLFLTLYIIVLNLKSQHAILKSNLLVAPFFDVPMRIHWCLNFFSFY